MARDNIPCWSQCTKKCSEQGCWVGGKMNDSNSDLSKISDFVTDLYIVSDTDSLTKHDWNLVVNNFVATSNQWKSWYIARIICFHNSFKRNYPISTRIPNLGVWCTKRMQLDFWNHSSRTKKSDSNANSDAWCS